MNIQLLVEEEFKRVAKRIGVPTDSKYLSLAMSPFDLKKLNDVVQNDINLVKKRGANWAGREYYHKIRLKKITSQYVYGLRNIRFGQRPTTNQQLIDLRDEMKQSKEVDCDIYPCENERGQNKGYNEGTSY